jgi:hypothetical protein
MKSPGRTEGVGVSGDTFRPICEISDDFGRHPRPPRHPRRPNHRHNLSGSTPIRIASGFLEPPAPSGRGRIGLSVPGISPTKPLLCPVPALTIHAGKGSVGKKNDFVCCVPQRAPLIALSLSRGLGLAFFPLSRGHGDGGQQWASFERERRII